MTGREVSPAFRGQPGSSVHAPDAEHCREYEHGGKGKQDPALDPLESPVSAWWLVCGDVGEAVIPHACDQGMRRDAGRVQ